MKRFRGNLDVNDLTVPLNAAFESSVALSLITALVVSGHGGFVAALVLSWVCAGWPLVFILPARWKNRVSLSVYYRVAAVVTIGPQSLLLVSGVAIATVGDRWTAIVIGVSALYFLACLVLMTSKVQVTIRIAPTLVGASTGAILGLIADSYAPGIHTLTFVLYGATAVATTIVFFEAFAKDTSDRSAA